MLHVQHALYNNSVPSSAKQQRDSPHLRLSLVFICRENPRRSGISLFPDRPRLSRLMKTENRRYPRSSGMNGDKSAESGAFLFSRRIPDFCDGRRSFPTNENLNFDRRGRRRPSAMDFAHYQSPKLLGSSPPITNKQGGKHGVSGENPIYRQNLGRSGNSEISDRLGFSRHMKTRLYDDNVGIQLLIFNSLCLFSAHISLVLAYFSNIVERKPSGIIAK